MLCLPDGLAQSLNLILHTYNLSTLKMRWDVDTGKFLEDCKSTGLDMQCGKEQKVTAAKQDRRKNKMTPESCPLTKTFTLQQFMLGIPHNTPGINKENKCNDWYFYYIKFNFQCNCKLALSLKYYWFLLYVHGCFVCMYAHASCAGNSCRSQKRVSAPLD